VQQGNPPPPHLPPPPPTQPDIITTVQQGNPPPPHLPPPPPTQPDIITTVQGNTPPHPTTEATAQPQPGGQTTASRVTPTQLALNNASNLIPVPQPVAKPPIQVLSAPVPAGKTVTATAPNGGQLPCWVVIDPRTGAISANPSGTDAAANMPVTVVEHVPQANGSIRTLTITVKPDRFGRGGSQCNIVRTNPTAHQAGGSSSGRPGR
jgi:hypothetical protein